MMNSTEMRLALKIAFFLLTIIVASSILMGKTAKMKQGKLNLPKTIGVWSRPDSPKIVHKKNIFEYMDGAGELYIGYRFNLLKVYEYSAEDQNNILVELYFMKTSDDAFGLLSLDWGGDPVSLDLSQAPESQSALTLAPSSKALYGGGLLRIWSDDLYARIMAYRETPESKEAVLSLGRAIVAGRKNPPEPRLLSALPFAIGSEWKLRNDRIVYFRSHLVLNSFYYLSPQNVLNLGPSEEAVTAPYENIIEAKGHKRLQLIFVRYENPKKARQALDHFYKAYLPEHKLEPEKDFRAGSAEESSFFFKVEDGWLGYKLYEKCVAFVFECPDQESARKIINQIQFKIQIIKGGE